MSSDLFEPSVALRVLRLTPLILSTGSLMCAFDQTTSIRPFAYQMPPKTSGPSLSQWFPGFFRGIGTVVFISYPLAAATALTNAYASPTPTSSWFGGSSATLSPTVKNLYTMGAIFSLGHFLYGKYAMGLIGQICEQGKPGEQTVDLARTWLRMNAIRIATVNFWGFVMYFCATVAIL